MSLPERRLSVLSVNNVGPKIGMRHGQVLLIFSCGLIAYWARASASVAVVAMTKKAHHDIKTFDWDEKDKSIILSSFYWGYIITMLPIGQFGQKIGTKLLLFLTIFIPSILTILTPISVDYGDWEIFCAFRIVSGLFSGGIFPLFHIHLANWCPLQERNILGGFAYSGVEIGTTIAFSVSASISTTSLGWPGIFYIPGGVGLLWSILWVFYGTNSPEDAKSISNEEKNLIMSSSSTSKVSTKTPAPWKHILMSIPFWALVAVRFSHTWGFQTLLAEIPTYVNSVLKMDMKSNAVYSALPYLVMSLLNYVFMFLAEVISKTKCISLTVIRKSLSTLSQWGPAAALTWLAFIDVNNHPLAIALLTVSISLGAASTLGNNLNVIDLAPNNSGVIMGIVNTVANVNSITAPLIVGAIVTDEEDKFQWAIVLLIAAGIYFIGNSIYLIFGKMTKQPWDDIHHNN